MKKFLIIALLFMISCNTNKKVNPVVIPEPAKEVVFHKCPDPVHIRDTVYLTKKFDSLQIVIKKKNDSLFIERYKIERVKYYTKIVEKNPSQSVFLRGWINRVLK